MKVDLVRDSSGDWVALYVNGVCLYQGHSIQDDQFLSVLELAGAITSQRETNLCNDGIGAPAFLSEVNDE